MPEIGFWKLAQEHPRHLAVIALPEVHGGNVSSVARALGKARMQVQRWLRRHHLNARDFRR